MQGSNTLMDIYEIRLKNARALAAAKKLRIADVADLLGKAPTQVSRFMGKNPTKDIGSKIAREFEAAFGVERGYLDRTNWSDAENGELSLVFAQAKSRSIPVKSLAQIINKEQGTAEVSAPDHLHDHAVAYYLDNDSMEGVGREYIPRGATLYIVEGAKPEPGKIVLASLGGAEVIGEYSLVVGKPYLRPYNKQYQAVDISDAAIGGTLEGVYWKPYK